MRFRRVVVALDTASPAPAMATAIGFARALEAELVGLFVEDPDLISVAALTAAEIGFPFPAHRALDVGTMERGLRARAHVVRTALATRLAGDALKWTFEVVRGRTASALDAVAARDDVVVVALGGGARTRAPALHAFAPAHVARLYVGRAPSARDLIAIVPALDTPAEDIARLVRALAPRHGRIARLLLTGPDGHWRQWSGELDRLLADAAIATRIDVLAGATRTAVAQSLAGAPSGFVIALASTREGQAELLEALPLPLLVLPGADARSEPPGR